jgi:protein involved in polysaccharide export with SLBB domain
MRSGIRSSRAPWTLVMCAALVAWPAARGQTTLDTVARPTGAMRAGDVLTIRVYRDSELSGKYVIDADGNVQIPGLGVIRAGGLPPADITHRIVDALHDRGFRTPEIAVWPQIRVSVLGEVRTPALYPVDPGTSLMEVITMAGGPSERANLRRTRVIRDGKTYTVDFEQALGGGAARRGAGGRVALYSNDVVYVPAKGGIFTTQTLAVLTSMLSLALSAVTLIQVTKH